MRSRTPAGRTGSKPSDPAPIGPAPTDLAPTDLATTDLATTDLAIRGMRAMAPSPDGEHRAAKTPDGENPAAEAFFGAAMAGFVAACGQHAPGDAPGELWLRIARLLIVQNLTLQLLKR